MKIKTTDSRRKSSNKEERVAFMIKSALSYTLFLFVILLLTVFIHHISTTRTQESFWYQNDSIFDSAVSLFNNNLTLVDSYCRNLAQDDTLINAARKHDSSDAHFFISGYSLKQTISSHLYSYVNFPVGIYFVYLRNSGYVASINSFHTEDVFYDRKYKAMLEFDEWQALMLADNGSGTMYPVLCDTPPYTDNAFLYLVDIDSLTTRNVPATAGFHFDYSKLKSIFSNVPLEDGCVIIACDKNNNPVLYLSEASTPVENNLFFAESGIMDALFAADFTDDTAYFNFQDRPMRAHRAAGTAYGLTFYLAVPESVCPSGYQALFLLFLAVAALVALFLIFLLVRNNLRPLDRLRSELTETISDRNQLQETLDATRPILSLSYLRQLMTGNIISGDELAYIQKFLGLDDPGLRYYVMYCVAYENGFIGDTRNIEYPPAPFDDIIRDNLKLYFTYQGQLYLYSPEERVYALLLPFTGPDDKALIAIQEKLLKLHAELSEEHSIWFFAGIGRACPFQNTWESYQQAREMSGHTAKNYIFLPYEMLKKDSNAYYYPAEFSIQLVHFITLGQKEQIIDLFHLIREENIEERNLSVQLLKFLLSDIRNTLLKARFTVTNVPKEREGFLADIDAMVNTEHLTFRLCEDIALKLCELFEANSATESLIDSIVAYIRANFKDPSLGLNKISSEFNISESYFSHMFKETMNINFSVYLEDLRLNEAARLIREDPASLNEVALEVGYNSSSSFRRAFKKKFGVTPSAMNTH